MKRDVRLATLEQFAVVVTGIYLAGVGTNVMTGGDVTYSNYLRWPVAAPIALIIGVVVIGIGVCLHRED